MAPAQSVAVGGVSDADGEDVGTSYSAYSRRGIDHRRRRRLPQPYS